MAGIDFSRLDQSVALSMLAGAQVMVVWFSVIIANAYRERGLWLHAGATALALVAVAMLASSSPQRAQTTLLLLLALAGLQLRDLVSHVGAIRTQRLWLARVSAWLLPLLAVASAVSGEHLLLFGVLAWAAAAAVLLSRAWPQCLPWAIWLAAGYVALITGTGWLGWRALQGVDDPAWPVAAALTAWCAMNYLATVWRSRLFSETRIRVYARTTIDPLTGLATPLVFHQRVDAVRELIRRHGRPSVLLLVDIENLGAIKARGGAEVAESAVLVAADRIRTALGEGDVAARLTHSRIALLCEGLDLDEGVNQVASRVIVAGLKDPLPLAPTEFLQFRLVLAAVPLNDVPSQRLLQRMSERLDAELAQASERRIVTIGADDML